MKTKFFVAKNGRILRSYTRKTLALSYYVDLLRSSDLDSDIVEFWEDDVCVLINSL